MTESGQDSHAAASPSQRPSAGVPTPSEADAARSGADVADAIETAEAGSRVDGAHSHPEETSKPGAALTRIEEVVQAHDEGASTESTGGGTTIAPSLGPSPADAGSGGAQSNVGARVSDRLAGGEPQPEGSPFHTDAVDRATDADR